MHNHAPIRQQTAAEARAILDQRPLYLDTETTGLDGRAEIVEIAILDYDGSVLLESLVKPRLPIPREVVRIHGITDQRVRNAPTWAEIWPQAEAILQDRLIGIYNAGFDLRIMEQCHNSARLMWGGLNSFCIMNLYARFYGERRNNSFRWQSLANAATQCRLSLVNSHRAADDARLARAVLHHMAGG